MRGTKLWDRGVGEEEDRAEADQGCEAHPFLQHFYAFFTEPLRLPARRWLYSPTCSPWKDTHDNRAGDRTFQGPIASPAHREEASSRCQGNKDACLGQSGVSLIPRPRTPSPHFLRYEYQRHACTITSRLVNIGGVIRSRRLQES